MLLNILKKKKRRGYLNSAKQIVFLVGTGRCGTTILSQVLNAHSRICVPPELQIIVSIGNGDRLYEKYICGTLKEYYAQDFINLISKCCPYNLELYFDYCKHFEALKYPQINLREILKELFDDICFFHKKEVFIEQTPWYGQRLDILKGIFPEMKVIHMIRDGRDVAISFSRTPWWTNDIRENILRWGKEINTIRDFGFRHPENFLEIRYEDLVLNPEVELNKVLKLFNLQFEKGMLDSENLINYATLFKGETINYQSKEFKGWFNNKHKVFFKESIFSWKTNKEADFKDLPKEVLDTLKFFNYEV